MFRTIFDEEKKQWNGPQTDTIFNPNTSLGNVILNSLQVNGSRIAQVRFLCVFFTILKTMPFHHQSFHLAENSHLIICN